MAVLTNDMDYIVYFTLSVWETDGFSLLHRWEHLIYQFGGHQELIKYVIIKGNVVYENDRTMDY